MSNIYNGIPKKYRSRCGYFRPSERFIPICDRANYVNSFGSRSDARLHVDLVAYYAGSFGEFHDGHMDVVRRVYEDCVATGLRFVIVIAPSNSDYAVNKYGFTQLASNKHRYDAIMKYANEFQEMNVELDLNPMLNFRIDHNFTDLAKYYMDHNVMPFKGQKLVFVGGKDRDYRELNKRTDQCEYWFYPEQVEASTSTRSMPVEFKKAKAFIRVHTTQELAVVEKYLGEYYESIEPIFIDEELEEASKLVTDNTVTICKDYTSLPNVSYYKQSRIFDNPLHDPRHIMHPDLFNISVKNNARKYRVIDSDIFSGGTKEFVERMGFEFVAVNDFRNMENVEVIDIDDLRQEKFNYPHVDLAWRCSLPPFNAKLHSEISALKHELKYTW